MRFWRLSSSRVALNKMFIATPLAPPQRKETADVPRAYNFIRTSLPPARMQAIQKGLSRGGWSVIKGAPPNDQPQTPQDVIAVWSRHRGVRETACRAFEMAGGRAIIFEEGQIKAGHHGEKLFTVCLDDHNGAGDWPVGGPERWASFGIELAPWRIGGDKFVVREQRGIGSKRMAMPKGWDQATVKKLHNAGHQAEIRRHPKITERLGKKVVPLETQIADARVLVTWGSSDAVGAVISGCPAIVCAPATFLAGCVGRSLEDVSSPPRGDRQAALERLAWCQWTLAEIRAGTPFKRLWEYLS